MKIKKALSLALAIGCLATSSAGLTLKAAKGNRKINNQKQYVMEVNRVFARRQANIEILVQAALEALKKEEASKAFGGDKNLQDTFQRIEEQRKKKYCNEKNKNKKSNIRMPDIEMERAREILLKLERFFKRRAVIKR